MCCTYTYSIVRSNCSEMTSVLLPSFLQTLVDFTNEWKQCSKLLGISGFKKVNYVVKM